jgi:hypothetical protein
MLVNIYPSCRMMNIRRLHDFGGPLFTPVLTFLFLFLLVSETGAHDGAGAPAVSGPKDPVCGFLKDFRYLEADKVDLGLAANLVVVDAAQINQPVTLRLLVRRQPGNLAVGNLQLEHEKFIHLIGVRDDLNEFFHVHPVKVSPGVWEVTHTFTHGGNYKIWTDVRYQDVSYAFGQPSLPLSGNFGDPGKVVFRDHAESSGYQVTFKHTEPLVAGRNASLQFLIRDAAGREVETDDYLGAPMHLVIVRDDLLIYRHAHPEHQDLPEPTIIFNQIFPQPGIYKLFTQFRPHASALPPDDAILTEFYVKVAAGVSLPGSQSAKTP